MKPVRIHFKSRLSLYFWRSFTFLLVLAGLFFLLLINRLYSSLNQDVVLIEASGGREVSITSLGAAGYSVPDKCIEDQILSFIECIRTVERNVPALRRSWLEAYQMCTPGMKRKMDSYYKAWSPDEMSRKTAVYVAPYLFTKRKDDYENYEIIWKELVWDSANNSFQGENYYRAVCGVVIRPPSSEKDMAGNPLGIFIDTFSVSYIKGGEESL